MAVTNKISDLESRLSELEKQRSNLRQQIRDEAEQHFVGSGGCERCDGRGWIVVWDTLDCVRGSYAQYGKCKNDECTPETRAKSGLRPRSSKYDQWNANARWVPQYTAEQLLDITQRDQKIRDLKSLLSAEKSRWTVSKDKICKVSREMKGPKARRVPVGTEGLVQKVWTNGWGGQKVIIVDSEGNQHWASIASVDVVDPDPDLSKWRKRDEENRRESGFPVVVTIKAVSRKAALIKTTTGPEFWVPFSQASELSSVTKGNTLSVFLPVWLAKKNGLMK